MKYTILTIIFTLAPIILNSTEPEEYKLKTVVIDAGHGGKDTGAQGEKSNEKDIVLGVALKLGKYIEENFTDVKVIYTRKTDEFIPLHERAKIANSNHADLFISIHANADPKARAIGTETYAMGLHKTESNLEVAKLENSVIYLEEDYSAKYEGFDPGEIESYIIFEMLQDIHLMQSLTFASVVQKQFRERVKRVDRGVKQAGFLVLWRTTMPSVLIELGYITHNREEEFLMSDNGQDYLASAIYRAFKEYKLMVESKSNFEVDEEAINGYHPSFEENNNDSVYFRIQIAASSNPITPDHQIFYNYSTYIELFHNDVFKYAVGKYPTYKEAKDFLKKVKFQFPDAFLIATQGNDMISVKEAIELQ